MSKGWLPRTTDHARYQAEHERIFGGEGRCSAKWAGGRCDLQAGHEGVHRHEAERYTDIWTRDGRVCARVTWGAMSWRPD